MNIKPARIELEQTVDGLKFYNDIYCIPRLLHPLGCSRAELETFLTSILNVPIIYEGSAVGVIESVTYNTVTQSAKLMGIIYNNVFRVRRCATLIPTLDIVSRGGGFKVLNILIEEEQPPDTMDITELLEG